MTMRRLISPLSLLLSGFALAPACGGAAEKPGGDGDGDDGQPVSGTGSFAGDGDAEGTGGGSATGGGAGDGDAAGGGENADTDCAPFAARLCDSLVGDEVCTGYQTCDEDGAAWSACECRSVEVENAGGAGGAGPVDGEPICSDVRACGGLVAGQWVVRSSCLSVGGTLDILALGLGCGEVDIVGALEVRGRLSLSETGEIADQTATVGSFALGIAPECRDVSGTVVTCEQIGGPLESFGFSEVRCLDGLDGGCACVAHVHQAGGLGHVNPEVSTHGIYSVNGEELEFSGLPLTYSYCALENSLTVSPTGTGTLGEQSGTVVFERVD